VILAKKVLVDNDASRENLLKFATFSKCDAQWSDAEGGATLVRMTPPGTPASAPAAASAIPAVPAGGAVVLITADGIGRGDEDLARLLMRGFLYTLTESDVPPERIILMNAGVRLAVEGSDSLGNLRKLSERGVEILACGTCLEFYALTASLGVGRITNMYEISSHLLQGPAVSIG
jgi:selenium metabolism protein YedF